jgi:REP-associated tyrosine transposase
MYSYRDMTPEQRDRVIEDRRRKHQPWHSPPHYDFQGRCHYIISASCYEHRHIIGKSPKRMSACEEWVMQSCREADIYAWCILPNHYHILLRTEQIKALLKKLGEFHGRSSFHWNGEDGQRGRTCWYNGFERYIRSERHFWASLNYIHNNPVHHGYVGKWQDWIWSSAGEFLLQYGREEALRIWREYPLLGYGKKWDR